MLRTTVRLPTVPFVTPPHFLSRAIMALGSIHHIGKIRNFLSRSATERLIHAFFSSKRDYCKSILHSLPSYELEKLQRLQNTAARLSVRAKNWAHVTPVLKTFHWFPL